MRYLIYILSAANLDLASRNYLARKFASRPKEDQNHDEK